MPWCSNGDIKLRYSERGTPAGPPVVLVPGLLFSRRMHERLARLLPKYRVLLLDVRGHGQSSSPTNQDAYGWRAYASDVATLLDHLGIEKAVVGGTSFGANVTIAFAAEHVDRLAGAIVEMPVGEAGRREAERMFSRQANQTRRTAPIVAPFARLIGTLRTSSPELAALRDFLSRNPMASVAVLRALLEDDETLHRGVEQLARASVPTLVLGHRRIVGPITDRLHHIDDALDLAGAVPGAEFVEVGSLVDLRLSPDRYAAIVDRFLTTL